MAMHDTPRAGAARCVSFSSKLYSVNGVPDTTVPAVDVARRRDTAAVAIETEHDAPSATRDT